MLLRLVWATLSRHRSRTLLAILGVAVSAAMLLDMVMLSSGMRESFRDLLLTRGFQLRISPKGTLPFDTDATIPGANEIVQALHAIPGVQVVSPVLGGQLHVEVGNRAVSATTLGVDPAVQGDYQVTAGREAGGAERARCERRLPRSRRGEGRRHGDGRRGLRRAAPIIRRAASHDDRRTSALSISRNGAACRRDPARDATGHAR